MTLKEALVHLVADKAIRRAEWPENECVRLMTFETLSAGKRLRLVYRTATDRGFIAFEDLDAGATDWEIFTREISEVKPEDKPFRDMRDDELLAWTQALARRLAHQFSVRRPSPRFDAMKYALRTVSYICNL